MKAETLNRRIQKIALTKTGELRKDYDLAMEVIMTGKAITGYYTGSGKYTKAVDRTIDTSTKLNLLKIKHTVGNDAPRGGVNGNYIKLTAQGRRQVEAYVKAINEQRTKAAQELKEREEKLAKERKTEIELLSMMIERVYPETYQETCKRLSAKLDSRVDSAIFHQAVKRIRAAK